MPPFEESLKRYRPVCRYILDIRNNGGGLFPAGVEVARMLMKDGDIVLIADSQGVRDSYSANGIAVETSAPLSVLVNRGTASASEVIYQSNAWLLSSFAAPLTTEREFCAPACIT